MPINRIRIKNFKSIRDSGEIYFKPINILIGPNGAGKSNFILFYKLLHSIYKRRLKIVTAENGYENNLLHFGRKKSKFIEGYVVFKNENEGRNNRYDFKLIPKVAGYGFYFENDLGGYNAYSTINKNEHWNYIQLGGEAE